MTPLGGPIKHVEKLKKIVFLKSLYICPLHKILAENFEQHFVFWPTLSWHHHCWSCCWHSIYFLKMGLRTVFVWALFYTTLVNKWQLIPYFYYGDSGPKSMSRWTNLYGKTISMFCHGESWQTGILNIFNKNCTVWEIFWSKSDGFSLECCNFVSF